MFFRRFCLVIKVQKYELVLRIFGLEGAEAGVVKYTNWLSEIRAGLLALEFYAADAKKWGQVRPFYAFYFNYHLRSGFYSVPKKSKWLENVGLGEAVKRIHYEVFSLPRGKI